jgi:hypothetical protein
MGVKTSRTDLDLVWGLVTAPSDKFPVGMNCPASRALPVLRALVDWHESVELFCSFKLDTLLSDWSHFVFPEAARLGQAYVIGSLHLELKGGRFRE